MENLSRRFDPVPTDTGFSILPTKTFADCPEQLDIIPIPGGFGSKAALQDKDIPELLKSRGPSGKYVTSACSGSTVTAQVTDWIKPFVDEASPGQRTATV